MTHADLAKALSLSRPQVSKDIKRGMPANVKGAKAWREDNKLFQVNKSGRKPAGYDYGQSEGWNEPNEPDDLLLVLEIAGEIPSLASNEKERKILTRAAKYITEEVRILINTRG